MKIAISRNEYGAGFTFLNNFFKINPGKTWPQLFREGHLAQNNLRIVNAVIPQNTVNAIPSISELLKIKTAEIKIAVDAIIRLKTPFIFYPFVK
jgi:hypothetical protein